MNDPQMYKEWLKYAVRDYDSARFLTGMHPQPLEIICFHCQQAAEKALKSILVYHGLEAPKLHHLPALCDLCNGLFQLSPETESACTRLNAYGVQPRYPTENLLETKDMERALQCCGTVLQDVNTHLSQLDRQPASEREADGYDLEP